jgi:hypothetical protein
LSHIIGNLVRRILLFVFSAAALGAGVYLVWMPFRCALGFADGECWVIGKLVVGGAVMILVGGYLLWDDFVSPWMSKQAKHGG